MFSLFFFFFFFNDTATTEIYTLSLHDALPISTGRAGLPHRRCGAVSGRETRCQTSGVHSASGTPESAAALPANPPDAAPTREPRSEEHTSELQSLRHLVCRLLLE